MIPLAKCIQMKDSGGDNVYPRAFDQNNLTNSSNLDDIMNAPHMAWCTNVGGKPSGSGAYGYVFMPGTNNLQIYFEWSTNGIVAVYLRNYTNNQWYPWRKITTSAI